jgi:hypothetical protein
MEALHGLADFNKPYPHGVEDQSVAELAAGQMATDGLDRCPDVVESSLLVTGHNATASE